MANRRDFLATATLAAAGAALAPLTACSRQQRPPASPATKAVPAAAPPATFSCTLLTRAIPSSGEKIPVIGLGTSGSFEVGGDADERAPLREVLATLDRKSTRL